MSPEKKFNFLRNKTSDLLCGKKIVLLVRSMHGLIPHRLFFFLVYFSLRGARHHASFEQLPENLRSRQRQDQSPEDESLIDIIVINQPTESRKNTSHTIVLLLDQLPLAIIRIITRGYVVNAVSLT